MGDGAEKRLRLFAGNLADLEQYLRQLFKRRAGDDGTMDRAEFRASLDDLGMTLDDAEAETGEPTPEQLAFLLGASELARATPAIVEGAAVDSFGGPALAGSV